MSQLVPLLIQLTEGQEIVLRFPSLKEAERFRIGLYKAKSDFDAWMFVADPFYEIKTLIFHRVKNDDTPFQFKAKLVDKPKKLFDFEIVD